MSSLEKNNRPHREKTIRDLRYFGWIMAACFAVFGAALRWSFGATATVPPILLSVAAIFLVLGTLLPAALRPVERGWMVFAERLSVVTTFIIMLVLFYLIITPTGLLLRVLGKDLLNRKMRPDLPSYWTPTEPDGPSTRPYSPF